MTLIYRYLFPALWLCWAAYWWASSRNVKTTTRQESPASRISHLLPLVIAIWLIALPQFPLPYLDRRYLSDAEWPFWIGAVLLAAGLGFAVWARVHLGRNWSGTVTIKDNHELITTGPYALVRHPIYTGLLLGFVGSALALSNWRGVLAVALVLWSFVRKLRIEERWMREQFGDAYVSYSQRVRALVPFVF